MAVIGWIATIVLLIIVGVLVSANLAPVELNLWLLKEPLSVPLYWVGLAPLIVGSLMGLAVGWASGGTARRKAREERRRAQQLQRQLAAAQRSETAPSTPSVPAALPPAMSETAQAAQLAGPAR